MMIHTKFLPFLLALAPIVRRADVPDARYVDRGKRFPAVIALGRAGDGTLIAPQWVLTAAHVARAVDRSGWRSIRIGGRDRLIEGVTLHPAWRDLGEHDIALIRLSAAVTDVVPVPLYRGRGERGQTATLVGHGGTGTGDARARAEDGIRRAATSVVDSADGDWLYFSFDAPPGGTPLEGAPGPGDSGGPAMLFSNGHPAVAGISSAGFDGANGPGTYGAVDAFTRVSSHAAWIDSTMAQPRAAGQKPPSPQSADTTLPGTIIGNHFRAFIAAARAGTDSAMTAFVREHFDSAQYQSRPALIPNLRRIGAQIGRGPVEAVVTAEQYQMSVRFRTTAGALVLELVCDAHAPHKLVDWRRFD